MLRKDNLPQMKPQGNPAHSIHDLPGAKPASEIKELIRKLTEFNMDELRQIFVLPEGTHLEQGATYVDLEDEPFRPFTAGGAMYAGACTVPKDAVPHMLWNRLIGISDPYRTQ
jgi:hypothetical protein